MIKSPVFSIVIPYYNNRIIAPECLPSVLRLRQRHAAIDEIIAVDDCSNDGTAGWICRECPEVAIISNPHNFGFGRSCFIGISRARNEWVILLNSDVKLDSDIITPLSEDLQNYPDIFAVGFLSFNENGGKFESRKKIVPKTGLFKTRNDFSADRTDGVLYDTLYACGGHCLINREKFLALGGFSPIFEPFYWEDTDLSYRALKRGWSVYFDPRCRVVHHHRGSIQTAHRKRLVSVIQMRNRMLFFWKNVSSPMLWLYHSGGMLFRLLTSWIAGDFVFYHAFQKALAKLPQAIELRAEEKKYWVRKDRELFRTGSSKNK